jgi:hypothetical protein
MRTKPSKTRRQSRARRCRRCGADISGRHRLARYCQEHASAEARGPQRESGLPCRRCGADRGSNRIYCADCHALLSDGLGLDEAAYLGPAHAAE